MEGGETQTWVEPCGLCCLSLCLGPLTASVPHPIHGLFSIAGPRRHGYLVAMQAFLTCGSQPFLP